MGAGVVFFLALVAPTLLLALAIPYGILRLRDSRKEVQDPQLGLKCMLHFIHSVGLILLLTGLTILADDVTQSYIRPNFRGSYLTYSKTQRMAAGLMAAGLLLSLFQLLLIVGFTNNRKWPESRRVFVGWRLAIHSMVVITAFTALVVTVFQEAPVEEELMRYATILVVWFASWLIHLILLKVYRGAGSKPAEGGPVPVTLVH
jgi:hypothetical protein